MAKQPEVRDRFRIFAETSSEAMGPLLAQLTRMGLENIGYELITDVRRFTQNGERKVHETSSVDFATDWVKDHPTFKAVELAHHFRDNDRIQDTAYGALRDLVKNGTLIKLSPGNYQRSDVKAISPPSTSTEKKKRGQVDRYDTTNNAMILRFIRRRKRVTVQETGAHLEAEGRNKKSASPIISLYAKAGYLKQVEPGIYDVVTDKLPATKEKSKSKLNGQGSMAHG